MRINRNTRRSARPVFRSVNSNRRRAVNKRKALNCSANSNVVYYSDLNKAQKDYVLDNWDKWSEMNWLWDIFYDDVDLAEDENAVPERWWVDEMLDGLSYDDIATFEIVDDKTVVPERMAPDDFNTYLNSNRRNRRRLLNSGRQRLNCAVAGDIVTFNELNEAQKQSAIKNIWNTRGAEWVYDAHNEDVMDMYHYDVEELTKQYNKLISDVLGQIYEIDAEQLYWDSSSQGPYPDWIFSDVFPDFTVEYVNNTKTVSNQTPSSNGKPPVEAIEVIFSAYGDKLDVWSSVSFDSEYYSVEDEDWLHETAIDPGDEFNGFAADIAVPAEAVSKITRTVGYMQEYIDAVWSLVRNVSMEVPDDEYAYELYEANDWGDFEVIDDQTAEYFNDDPAW